MRTALAALVLAAAWPAAAPLAAQDSAVLTEAEAGDILARTETIALAPDLSHLSPVE